MGIRKIINDLQRKTRKHKQYEIIATKAGVSHRWVTKFANNEDPNPTVKMLEKIETFFNDEHKRKVRRETL